MKTRQKQISDASRANFRGGRSSASVAVANTRRSMAAVNLGQHVILTDKSMSGEAAGQLSFL